VSDGQRTAQTPPDPVIVTEVMAWFQQRGFETGPFVGTSFAITGSDSLFRDAFGDTSVMDEHTDAELSLGGLSDEVAAHVAAIAVSAPPDFGPGNP
jgi:hypothetical protein